MPFHTLRRLGVRISSAVRCLFGRVESPEERYRDFNGRYFSGFYEQERMLADKPRMEFYRAAIQRHIQPGARVIDLGTGTGILAALASRRGAAKVYAIDHSSILETARTLATATASSASNSSPPTARNSASPSASTSSFTNRWATASSTKRWSPT